ncbi:hypothetical protein DWF00_18130 [Bosea caraganae]|uniref:Uncharacterized protein n=1 Tax=Bosea caraganae TaxID=2763117 RepID=A0A370L856_9HYPH|nr:hypothetical protein DWF00_18130 [Bosea caraganae]RDJ26227.1 hypothetical protein DWE98_10350 [Bosea caraganae]
MLGLVPSIHALQRQRCRNVAKTWMVGMILGSSPRTTMTGRVQQQRLASGPHPAPSLISGLPKIRTPSVEVG